MLFESEIATLTPLLKPTTGKILCQPSLRPSPKRSIRFTRELKSLTRRFESSHKDLKSRNESFKRALLGFEKRQQSFEKRQLRFEKIVEQLNKRQDKFDDDLNAFWEKMLALHNQEARKAEQDRLKSQKVIDQIYAIADRITKYFDDFNVEKLALGARDSRIENRVGSLEESDLKQNHTIEKLDTRLTYLEARQPD